MLRATLVRFGLVALVTFGCTDVRSRDVSGLPTGAGNEPKDAGSKSDRSDGGGTERRSRDPDASAVQLDAATENDSGGLREPMDPIDAEIASDATTGGDAAATDSGTRVAITPDELPGLVLWLRGDRGVVQDGVGRVQTWEDQSGLDNHAEQPTANLRPWLARADAGPGPELEFDGTQTFLRVMDNPSLQWEIEDYLILCVARYRNSSDINLSGANHAALIWGKQSTVSPYSGVVTLLSHRVLSGQVITSFMTSVEFGSHVNSQRTELNDDVVRLYSARRHNGSQLEVRIDGASAGRGSVPLVNVSNTGTDVYIGGQNNTYILEGGISELVAIRGEVTDAQLSAVEANLLERHGLKHD